MWGREMRRQSPAAVSSHRRAQVRHTSAQGPLCKRRVDRRVPGRDPPGVGGQPRQPRWGNPRAEGHLGRAELYQSPAATRHCPRGPSSGSSLRGAATARPPGVQYLGRGPADPGTCPSPGIPGRASQTAAPLSRPASSRATDARSPCPPRHGECTASPQSDSEHRRERSENSVSQVGLQIDTELVVAQHELMQLLGPPSTDATVGAGEVVEHEQLARL
jgi:hypothetical protein